MSEIQRADIMKCVVIVLTLLNCLTLECFAGSRFGVIAGVNYSTLAGSASRLSAASLPPGVSSWKVDGPNYQFGYAIGIYGEFPVGPGATLAPEWIFLQKGGAYAVSMGTSTGPASTDVALTYNYVEVPLLLKAYLRLDGTDRPYILLGPTAAVLFSARETGSSSTGFGSADFDLPISNTPGRDFGFIVGGGTDLTRGSAAFRLELRLGVGLSSIIGSTGDSPDVRQQYLGIRGGVSF